MLTSDLHYSLPPEAIAQTPVEPRHHSRLLDARDMTDHVFLDLASLLRKGDLVVVNTTRVRAARIFGNKETGGRVELLLLTRIDEANWECLVRPARRIDIGTRIGFDGPIPLIGEITEPPIEGKAVVSLYSEGGEVEEAVEQIGEMPLPPYITAELGDRERYQTMFAARIGSAAAPTAALHFTPKVVSRLEEAEISLTGVELEVGLDTFRPIGTERVEDHQIHRERITIPQEAAAAIAACRSRGGRVVAVGTTVTRTLESMVTGEGLVEAGSMETGLFITPGFRFRAVDLMVTNFHLPGSSLLALLAAFMGADRWGPVYHQALQRGYRFLSFGDAMLVERSTR